MTYADTYAAWRADPHGWWLDQARAIDWDTFPNHARAPDAAPHDPWFADGMVNTCHNAVDRHVAAGHGDRIAIIHDSPVTGTVTRLTYAELRDATARLAGALLAQGIEAGDRVVIYMPMIPEAVVAMLACARIGAIHSVVFGGFAASELAIRIDDCTPRAILAASCGIEPSRTVPYKPMIDAAIDEAVHKPDTVILLQRPQCAAAMSTGRDIDWHDAQAGVTPAPCTPVRGDHPAYILYTSGTTGKPKGVVRPTGGHLVAMHWTMHAVYDVKPGEVFWAASDVGWVVGHSYICYAPLIHGNTTVLFEGKPVGTPDAGTFWRVIQDHGVSVFFTAPTAFRAIKREDPEGRLIAGYDTTSLRALYLAGERADPDTVHWAERVLDVPVYDHWWQTETGYTIVGNPVGLGAVPIKTGSPSVPMPGYEIAAMDTDGAPVSPGTLGALAIRLPLPPGCLPTLWNAPGRFHDSYLATYPGWYETGDAGMVDADGYVWIMARTDDVINVAGHRLSTGAMEEVLADHPDVAECAVVGVADDLKGQVALGLVCLNRGATRDHADIVADCVAMIRDRIGPVAAFRHVAIVDRLPKTRSGKILRRTLSALAGGEDYTTPATIDDPTILDEIADRIAALGLR